jgi:hypothetical protein
MEARDFKFAKRSVTGLTIATGAMAFAGVLSLFGEMFAAAAPVLRAVCIFAFAFIAVFALCVSQAASSCAMLLKGDEHRAVRYTAWVIAFMTALVSVGGGYLAEGVLKGHPPSLPPLLAMIAGSLALAFVKPAMAGIITACEELQRVVEKARDVLLETKEARITELERQLREALRARPADAVLPMENKGGTVSAPHARPMRARAETPPAIERKIVPTLPVTEEELRRAVDSLIAREGTKVISIESVRREAQTLLGREVSKKRIENHPLRREIVDARKTA